MLVFNVYIPDNVRDEISYYVDEIEKEAIPNAVKWYQGIISAIDSLNQSPERCPKADETIFHDFEIRHLIVGNYRILFRIENYDVQILHIKHSRMRRKPIDDVKRIQKLVSASVSENVSLSQELMDERRKENKEDN